MARRANWIGGLTALALALGLNGCDQAPATPDDGSARARPAVSVTTVREVDAPPVTRYAGVLRARDRAQPAFLMAGTLAERSAEIGDRIAAGAELARLHNPSLEPAVDAARGRVAELDERIGQLERDVERARALRERELNSPETVDRLESELAATRQARTQARAGLAEARARLEEATLRAPFDGRVTEVLAEPGDFIAAGQPILQLTGNDGLEVIIRIPSDDATRLSVDTPVTLTRPLDGGRFDGTITRIGSGGQRPSAVVIETGTDDLSAGTSVHVHLPGSRQSRLQLPLSAVIDPGGDAPHVFRLEENGDNTRVHRVAITAGRVDGETVEITDGLAAGDRVVHSGQGQLSDGQAVRVLP